MQYQVVCATIHLKEFNKGMLKIAVEKKQSYKKNHATVELLNIGNIKENGDEKKKNLEKVKLKNCAVMQMKLLDEKGPSFKF